MSDRLCCSRTHLQELGAGSQVRLVELVGHIPADGAKLAALLDAGVQVAQHKQQLAPLCAVDSIQQILCTTMTRMSVCVVLAEYQSTMHAAGP